MSERAIWQESADFRARASELMGQALTDARKGRSTLYALADVRGTAAGYLASYAAQLEARVLELTLQVGVDHLTGVESRAAIERALALELERTARTLEPTSVLVVDVDHFKRVNDERGHAAGDEVLRAIGAALNSGKRATDSVGRIGGEEFVVVLSGADELRAYHAAERVRQSIAALEFPDLSGLEVTASVGVATARGRTDSRAILKRADAALYRAKEAGRDRVNVAS